MATKKPAPAAKKAAPKRPAAKSSAPAKTASAKAAAPAPAVKKISKANPPAAKTAVVTKAQVAALEKSNAKVKVVAKTAADPVVKAAAKQVAAQTDKAVTTMKQDLVKKGTNKAKRLQNEAKFVKRVADHATAEGDVVTGERLRRSGQGLEKVAANIKDKVEQIASTIKPPSPAPKPQKKAALVAPSNKPKHHHHGQHRPQHQQQRQAPAPASVSATDVWNRTLDPKKAHTVTAEAPAPAPAPTASETLKAMLKTDWPTVTAPERPAQPPVAAKVAHQPSQGSMSVTDMNAVIASRRGSPAQGLDIKSLPFKR
jgi:hypothetical protein